MARLFNGSSDKLSIADSALLEPAAISVVVRFKPASNAGNNFPVLADKEPVTVNIGWIMHIVNTDEIKWKVNQDDVNSVTTSSLNFAMDVEHTAVGVWDGTTVTLFFDGASAGTASKSGTITQSAQDVTIGTYRGGTAGTYFKGNISLFAIYSGALDVNDANALYRGFDPTMVRPNILNVAYRIGGQYSPEIDIRGGTSMTVTGTSLADGPAIIMPRRRGFRYGVTAAGGGGFFSRYYYDQISGGMAA